MSQRLDTKEKSITRIMVRCTESERLAVKKRAHAKMKSVSEYIRELLFGAKP